MAWSGVMTAEALAIALATLVSEDLTAIGTGLLIREGHLSAWVGLAACTVGIYAGDLGLFALGRWFGPRILESRRLRGMVTPEREAAFGRWFSSNAASVILGSRFLPGTRLPLYVGAGALGGSVARFAAWSLVAAVLWVPAVVLLTARYGSAPLDVLASLTGSVWLARLLTVALLMTACRVAGTLATRRGRQRLAASLSRIWRWEFWPMWLFYAPVALWTALLAIRYGGFRTITAANPGMPDGGVVGESKHAILSRLPEEWTIPTIAVAPGSPERRAWRLVHQIACRGWRLPLVFKPDVGQRGAGVKIVRTLHESRAYLREQEGTVIVQPYHPGPCEAGIFYCRWPGSTRGRILSVTDKHFPAVVGDGRSTLEELIWADRRLRMQARTFLKRHADAARRVLAAGERMPLAIAGNHAQGTLFRDGSHLITPALEERIDQIARLYPGFFIGRFDVRYADAERFKAGEDLAIVELNGATAESTNIYDPDESLFSAYFQLFRQWWLVFAIGHANRAAGTQPSSHRRLFDLLRAHITARVAFQISD